MSGTQPSQGDEWSEDLMERTRLLVQRGLEEGERYDLHLKKNDRSFGLLRADDLAFGRLIVCSIGAETYETYSQVDDLMLAGWVVD
jgi:hypothetical protein